MSKKKKKKNKGHQERQPLNEPNALKKIFEPHQEILDKKIDGKKSNKQELDKPSNDSKIFADLIEQKHRQRRKRWLIILAAVLLLVSAGAIAFYYYIGNVKPFAEEKVTLQIDGPQKARVGEDIMYKIFYANQGDIAIKNAKLIFHEPAGFTLAASEPETTTHGWDLGNINPGQHGEVMIYGKIIDNLSAEQKLTANLMFSPENFNSDFTVEQNYYTSLEPISVSITRASPETINLEEKVTITLTLQNTLTTALEKMKLLVMTPDDFQISNTDPKAGLNANEWLIDKIEPQQILTYKLEGSFPETVIFENDDQRLKEFKVQTYYPNAQAQYFAQQEETFKLKIIEQELVTYLIINGSTEDKSVSLGEKLQFSLIYKNKGSKIYKNAVLSVIINPKQPDILDWPKIEDPEFGKSEKTDVGKKITWTKQQIPELETIAANKEGTINFSIPLKIYTDISDARIHDLGKNMLETYGQLTLSASEQNTFPSISSSKINLTLNTDCAPQTRAVYYYEDGTPIGSGPMPPQVGQATTYVVFWDITNQVHEIENIKVSATLPDKVSWTGKYTVSAGQVNFNPVTKEISWTINRLPLGAKPPTLNFNLELTPLASDAGTLMKLINNTTITATDSLTQNLITKTTNILTTNLDDDPYGVGQGVVTKAQ